MGYRKLARAMVAVAAIAAAQSAFAYGDKTAKDYVQDGLLMQFDGIANNGWSAEAGDIHAAAPSQPKELVANASMTKAGTFQYGDNYILFPGSAYLTSGNLTSIKNALTAKTMTVELFMRPLGYTNYKGFLHIGETTSYRELVLDQREDLAICKGGAFGGLQYAATGWTSASACCINYSTTSYINKDVLATIIVDSSGAHFYLDNGECLHTNTGGGKAPNNGKVRLGAYGNNGGYFRLYSARIYNRVLTAEERAANYELDQERFLGVGVETVVSAASADAETEVSIDGETWGANATTNGVVCPTEMTLRARNTGDENACFIWTGLPEGATFADDRKTEVSFSSPPVNLSISCRTATTAITTVSTDGEAEFSLDGITWSQSLSASPHCTLGTRTLYVRTPNNVDAVFTWDALPSGATYGDANKSYVVFSGSLDAANFSCHVAKTVVHAASTDGETEFSLDGTTWTQSLTETLYCTLQGNRTLYARTPHYSGAGFAWDTLPAGAAATDGKGAAIGFSGNIDGAADFSCHVIRGDFSATVTDGATLLSFDGESWVSALSLDDVYIYTNISVYARNTSGEDWACFEWTGLPSGAQFGDIEKSSTTFTLPLTNLLEISCCSYTAVTNTYIGGTGAFEAPESWSLGVAPAPYHDIVIPLAETEGTSYTITNLTAFTVRSLTIGEGGAGAVRFEVMHNKFNAVATDFTIKSGATLSHIQGGAKNIKTTVNYAVRFNVGGDMTIESGAAIDVTGRGHISGQGPTGAIGYQNPSGGASHGGVSAGAKYAAYDSALRPEMYGGGISTSGGGIIRLSVLGTLTVNGKIRSDTNHYNSYATGAGGAVWIDAGVLAGSGSITATAGDSRWGCSGCGGRIAVYLTNPSSTDFSAFSGGAIQAYGGRSYDGSATSDGRQAGSAGTIYLQAYGETQTNATLVIDNKRVASSSKNSSVGVSTANPVSDSSIYRPYTPLTADCDCGEIGNIIVRNGGYAAIESRTFKVYQSITVENARFKPYSGTLELVGNDDVLIKGTNIYNSVSCTVPGKTIKFGSGANDEFRVADGATLTLTGSSEAPLVLRPETAGESWKLTLAPTADPVVRYVTVDHSDASGGIAITARSSTDGGNNQNWSFPMPIDPGDTITWNGEESDLWSTVENWTDKFGRPRLPVDTDVVVIPSGCTYYPAIMANTYLNSLNVAPGAALTLTNGARLDITNAFTMAGTFTITGTEKVYFSGTSLNFSGGTVIPNNSIFTIEGDLDATLDFDGNTLRRVYVRKTGGTASFTGNLTAETFDALATNVVTFAFGEGVTLSARNLYCRSRAEAGAADPALLTLRGIVAGEGWNIAAEREEFFSGVKVRDSSATALAARADALSENLGNNSNWTFGATAAEWLGGSGSFDAPEKWYPAAVPGANADVLITGINGSSAVTASGAVTVRSIKLGGGTAASSLTVQGVLTTSQDLIVETNATLTLNSPLVDNVVGRDFIVRNGGTATHTLLPASCDTLADADASGYRFRLDVGRDVLVESGSSINVTAKGYNGAGGTAKGPLGYGKTVSFDSDDDGVADRSITLSSGGHAGVQVSTNLYYKAVYLKSTCYGSMFEPTAHGSGGKNDTTHGGGVVKIKCAGDMTVNGVIRADGKQYQDGYGRSAAGGSVWLDIGGEFSGAGEITARGGLILYDNAASGGRIAIYYGTDSFTGTISASAAPYTSHNRSFFAGSGTVLKKAKGGVAYDVVIDNDQYYRTQSFSATYNKSSPYWANFVNDIWMRSVVTDIPSKDDLDKLDLFKRVRFSVGHLTALNLQQNLKIKDLNVTVNTGSYVRLNGYTLRVMDSTHKNARGWAGASVERSTRERGEIIWGAGFAVTVR